MNARRALIALAGVIVLGSSLSACDSDKTTGTSTALNGAGKTLNVLVPPTPSTRPAEAVVHRRLGAVQGADRREVKFETFASANDELTKIQTSVLSGQGPDVYSLGTTFTPTAYATGAFLELTADDWKKVGGRDKFLPATLGISGPDAQHEVGIPFTSRPFVMAYNKDCSTAAGIDKPADTWDGLLAQAKKLTTGGNYGLAVAYADGFDPWKFIWAMSVQAGNPLVNGKKAQLDRPSTLTAYQTYLGWLATDKVVDPAAVGWKNAQAIAAFGAGKAAFLPMVSATSKVTLDKSAVAGKYAYAIMPTVPPGATALPAGGRRRDQHPVRRQPGRGQVHQEQGPRPGPGQAADQRRVAGHLLQDVRRAADQRGGGGQGCRPTRRSRRSSTRPASRSAPRSTAPGARSSWPWSTWSCSRSRTCPRARSTTAALNALLGKAQTDAQAALDKAK